MLRFVLAGVAVLAFACDSVPEQVCTPGQVQTCGCADDQFGSTTCRADGTAFNACNCPEPSATSTGDVGGFFHTSSTTGGGGAGGIGGAGGNAGAGGTSGGGHGGVGGSAGGAGHGGSGGGTGGTGGVGGAGGSGGIGAHGGMGGTAGA